MLRKPGKGVGCGEDDSFAEVWGVLHKREEPQQRAQRRRSGEVKVSSVSARSGADVFVGSEMRPAQGVQPAKQR